MLVLSCHVIVTCDVMWQSLSIGSSVPLPSQTTSFRLHWAHIVIHHSQWPKGHPYQQHPHHQHCTTTTPQIISICRSTTTTCTRGTQHPTWDCLVCSTRVRSPAQHDWYIIMTEHTLRTIHHVIMANHFVVTHSSGLPVGKLTWPHNWYNTAQATYHLLPEYERDRLINIKHVHR